MRNLFLAFEDEEVVDAASTEETIEETPEKKDLPEKKEEPKEEPKEKEKEVDKETPEEDKTTPDEGDEEGGGGDAKPASAPEETPQEPAEPEVNDTPPEDRPRFDDEVLSIDKVMDKTKTIRDKNELEEPKEPVAQESYLFNGELRELSDQEPTMLEMRDGLAIEFDDLDKHTELAIESLFAVSVCMESYLQLREPIPPKIGQAQNILIKAMIRPLGFKVSSIGMESYAADRNRLAMEGLGDLVVDMLSAIINAIKRFCRFILSLFGWTAEHDERREASARRLEDRCFKSQESLAALDEHKRKEVSTVIASVYSYYDGYTDATPDKWDGIPPSLVGKKDEVVERLKKLAPKKFPNLVAGGLALSKERARDSGIFKLVLDTQSKLKEKMDHALQIAAAIRALVIEAGDQDKTRNYLENRTLEICKMTQSPLFQHGLSKKGSEDGFDLYEGVSTIGDYLINLKVAGSHSLQADEAAEMLFGFHYTCNPNTQDRPDVFFPPYDAGLEQARIMKGACSAAVRFSKMQQGEKIEKIMLDLEKVLEKFKKDVGNGVLADSFRQRIIQNASYWISNKLYHGLIQAHLPQNKFASDLLAYHIYCQDVHEVAFNIATK